ncbi:glycoside hydrolase family 27 protein [Frankia sp. R82]|uniref:glycoside hydrolase family 27 protein n=1 Tax=Frankia sp. R82 TaxID=2950553 RepID=UPI0020431FE1|nr:glycoside hydrolase family 27 protein [Frankia sp. R82]MCM3883256.1 glycoside hydrolase family 27 protein [Frankia sp. R82]
MIDDGAGERRRARVRGGLGSALVLVLLLVVLGLGGDGYGTAVRVGIPAHREVSARLARTPPMGWNSWNLRGAAVSAADIRAAADALVRTGMRNAGYRYVTIDDGWMTTARDEHGALVADPDRFPEGIAALARYVHGRGLKLGIYESPGVTTCQGRAGSYGHEAQDAATFASWGVDYLKYDACSYPTLHPAGTDAQAWLVAGFTRMRNALDATGRPIVYSINPSSGDPAGEQAWRWASSVANLWRVTNDHAPCWATVLPMDYYPGVCLSDNLDRTAAWFSAGGPGHWNDLDMLTVGLTPNAVNPDVENLASLATGRLSNQLDDTEARTELGVWSMFASPLIAGNDLTAMSPATRAVLTNRAVLAVDQDPLGAPAVRRADTGSSGTGLSDGLAVWTRQLAGGDTAVLVVNRGDSGRAARITGTHLALAAHPGGYQITDLWTGRAAPSTAALPTLSVTLAPHAAALLRLTPTALTAR